VYRKGWLSVIDSQPHAAVQATGAQTLVLANAWWEVTLRLGAQAGPSRVVDRQHGLIVADEPYCYRLDVLTGSLRQACLGLVEVGYQQHREPDGGQTIVLEGRIDLGRRGPTDVYLRHRITLPGDAPWLEEQITLQHRFGRHTHQLENLRFGLRKRIFDRTRYAWCDGMDRFQLTPVPHRRRFGHRVDRRATDYSAADLFPLSWAPNGNLPGHGSEAWLWSDGERGVLVAKYNQTAIEFGLFDGEFVLPESDTEQISVMDAVSSHIHRPINVCARMAGAGLYRGDPEAAQALGPDEEIAFGVTRLVAYRGDWQQGYDAYRTHLRALGHGVQPGFNPPLHWNELYNLGWRLGDNAPLQTPAQYEAEAAIAADIGAESLYLDPTWDIAEGTTLWDTARLGAQAAFARLLRERYNLGLSLHLMMHTTAMNENPAIYLRDADGHTAPFHLPDDLYPNARVCCATAAWKEMKKKRLLTLAEAGATFFMFDFLNYNNQNISQARVPQVACVDPGHGHAVPLTRQEHAAAILEVIQTVKQSYPNLLIEAHDRINGGMQDYHPLYFQHALPHSFDSNWGFEYMWDPYNDLISGKALSLYEYNLAYEIPLYLHIHEGRDSSTMLAFWWYASTCRHLGIGGVSDRQTPLYAALKQAVTRYRQLKPFFTQGTFIGLDTFTHVHVLPERNAAVILLFNLSGEPQERTVHLDAARLGLRSIDRIEGGQIEGEAGAHVPAHITVPALSPVLLEVN
jgi:hypothetical protein